MGVGAKLVNLRDNLKDLIEEKTWYAEANPILDIAELDLKIRLAMYLIEHLDVPVEKTKFKLKLKEDQLVTDEKKEELEEEMKKDYIVFLEAEARDRSIVSAYRSYYKTTLHFAYSPQNIHTHLPTLPAPALVLENEFNLLATKLK